MRLVRYLPTDIKRNKQVYRYTFGMAKRLTGSVADGVYLQSFIRIGQLQRGLVNMVLIKWTSGLAGRVGWAGGNAGKCFQDTFLFCDMAQGGMQLHPKYI